MNNVHLRQLFADAPLGERCAFEALGLYFDYSKNRITEETIKLLLEFANESGLRERIGAMFSGENINVTEKRAVLHIALRTTKEESIIVGRHERGARGSRRARPHDDIREGYTHSALPR